MGDRIARNGPSSYWECLGLVFGKTLELDVALQFVEELDARDLGVRS